ncbi:MAG: hypothetical protein RJA44_379 [Pseudomonadota bacterium]
MRTLRAIGRLTAVALHVLHGLLIVLLRFGALGPAERQQRIGWWSRGLLQRLGIALELQGTPHAGATLLVANHVSWLDISAIHAVCPQARFVSKSEVRHWPLIGRLVEAAGTLFIEREKKRDAMRVMHQMAEALQAGDTVAVFPEGTTGDGHALLPFHGNLLHAAITTATPVQPVALRFADAHAPVSAAAAYIGDTTLLQSLWMIASAEGLRVRVQLLPAVSSAGAERRTLAPQLAELIGAALDR